MQVLSGPDYSALLRLLFSLDSKTYGAIKSEFSKTFVQRDDRIRACCAALLLLEDSRALSTAQRLGTWFAIHSAWDDGSSSPPPHPYLPYLVEVAGDTRRSSVERHLVWQLLLGHQVQQLECHTPLDYALSYSLPLYQGNAGQDLPSLRAKFNMGPAPGTPAALDQALQEHKKVLVSQAVALCPKAGVNPIPILPNGTLRGHSRSGSPRAPPYTPSTPEAHASEPSSISVTSSHPVTSHDVAALGVLSSHRLSSDVSLTTEDTGTDSTSSTDPRWANVKDLIDRALAGPLLPAQQATVLDVLAEDVGVLARCGVGPAHLPALIEHTPAIAVELLTRLAGSPQLPDYLAVLASTDMSLHSMEVVNRLTTSMDLPTDFLHLYITNCIQSCESTADKYVQSRLVRLLCVFLQSLIRNRLLHVADLLHEVQSFCVNFSRIREAAKLFRLLKQIESGGRLGGSSDGVASPTAAGSSQGLGGAGHEGGDGHDSSN